MKKISLSSILQITAIILVVSCNTQQGNRKSTSPGNLPDSAGLTATEEMVPFTLFWEGSEKSKLNLSFILDKPAGKDGIIVVRDGHLYRPDGTRFKMWGVNITGGACFPEKEDAPAYAAFLARFGINAVRLHFLDSNWGEEQSLFKPSSDNTRELYPPMLDRVDFFISELKKAGIYTDINLNVGRTFRKGDGVPDYMYMSMSKAITHIDYHVIKLQKEYAMQLLTHVNPYTGNAYVNEPAIAVVELVNENSLVEAWHSGRLQGNFTTVGGGSWQDIPPHFAKELTVQYNAWLKKNASPDEIKEIAKESGVIPGQLIPRLSPQEFKNASKLRFHTEARFIMEKERNFYLSMYRYLKDTLGVKCPIISNSDHGHSRNNYALLSNNALLDIVDGHVYWQHPSNRRDPETGKAYRIIENTPMVNDPAFSTIVQLSRSAVEGKPYTVSETNHPYPSEYACEGLPVLSAYSMLQDWDGVFLYTLEHTNPKNWNTNLNGHFDIATDPVRMTGMAACGLMFLRGDIRPAPGTVLRGYSKDDIIEGIREDSKNRPMFTPGFSDLLPLMTKTRVSSFEERKADFPLVSDSLRINAETGEILWHNTGDNFIEISAPKAEAIAGFMNGETTILKHLSANLQNRFAAVTLVTLDDKPVAESEKMLLLTTGKMGVTGMKWDDKRQWLPEAGSKPTTIEVIKGDIRLAGLDKAKSVTVEPLDGSGNPMKSYSFRVRRGKVTIPVGNDITVWYNLEISR